MTHDLLVLIWRGTFIASAAICLVLLLRLPMSLSALPVRRTFPLEVVSR